MPTIEEALQYLGIDYSDEVIEYNVLRALNTAYQLVLGGVGDDVDQYLPDDPRVTELILIYMEDLYSQRGLSPKVSSATRRLVADMEQQLRLELKQAIEAAEEETKA